MKWKDICEDSRMGEIEKSEEAIVDLVPNVRSEAFRVVERAQRTGRRVSTKGMTDDEFMLSVLGKLPDEKSED